MKVNFDHRTIVLTKKEMKQASIPYTQEYQMLLGLMRDLPDFTVKINHTLCRSNANRGLSYEAMSQRIAQEAPELMDESVAVRSVAGYPAASQWFRKHFAINKQMVDLCSNLGLAA